jgi:predicted thioesterase
VKPIEQVFPATHSFEVTLQDVPVFDGKIIHPVCSTYKLTQEAEWAGRRVLLQMLEGEEEGIGSAITLAHHSPAHVGKTISITAKPVSLAGNKLICSFEARMEDTLVADGTTEQTILPRKVIDKILKNS